MKIITGGQRGVDLGAVKAAKAAGIPTGGFIPLFGRTESGSLSPQEIKRFDFCEVASYDYRERTRLNVGIADALLLISDDYRSAGTVLTRKLATERNIPILELKSSYDLPIEVVKGWLQGMPGLSVLMVAGNRESKSRDIEARVELALVEVFGVGDQNQQGDP